MSHAFALVPNFTVSPDGEPLPFHADPILAAIERHEEAFAVYQVAPQGDASDRAFDEYAEALDSLLGTACATRPGAFCLLRHLRWWMGEEASNADAYAVSWPIALAREADLTLLLGCDGIERLARIPVALPSGRLPAPPLALPAPGPIPTPLPTPVHFGRFCALGEIVGALVLVAGGCWLTGFASLL